MKGIFYLFIQSVTEQDTNGDQKERFGIIETEQTFSINEQKRNNNFMCRGNWFWIFSKCLWLGFVSILPSFMPNGQSTKRLSFLPRTIFRTIAEQIWHLFSVGSNIGFFTVSFQLRGRFICFVALSRCFCFSCCLTLKIAHQKERSEHSRKVLHIFVLFDPCAFCCVALPFFPSLSRSPHVPLFISSSFFRYSILFFCLAWECVAHGETNVYLYTFWRKIFLVLQQNDIWSPSFGFFLSFSLFILWMHQLFDFRHTNAHRP